MYIARLLYPTCLAGVCLILLVGRSRGSSQPIFQMQTPPDSDPPLKTDTPLSKGRLPLFECRPPFKATPPMDRQTWVKTLHSRKLRLRAVKSLRTPYQNIVSIFTEILIKTLPAGVTKCWIPSLKNGPWSENIVSTLLVYTKPLADIDRSMGSRIKDQLELENVRRIF